MKLEIPRQNFEKQAKTKFYENRSSGSRVVPCEQAGGRTDRHDEANSRFSQFCERTYKCNVNNSTHGRRLLQSCRAKYKWRLSIIPDPTKQATYWAVETLHTKHFKQNVKSLFSYCRDAENIRPISIISVALFCFCEKLISVEILFILNVPNITSTFHIAAIFVTVHWQTVFSI